MTSDAVVYGTRRFVTRTDSVAVARSMVVFDNIACEDADGVVAPRARVQLEEPAAGRQRGLRQVADGRAGDGDVKQRRSAGGQARQVPGHLRRELPPALAGQRPREQRRAVQHGGRRLRQAVEAQCLQVDRPVEADDADLRAVPACAAQSAWLRAPREQSVSSRRRWSGAALRGSGLRISRTCRGRIDQPPIEWSGRNFSGPSQPDLRLS
jgi:hypothetical protein